MPRLVIYILAALLAIAALPLPVYGFYQFVRILACIGFGILAHDQYCRDRTSWMPWVLAALACLFNPIVPVHLGKEIWACVDVGAALFLVAIAKRLAGDAPAQRKTTDRSQNDSAK